jgi:type I thyroxine 5'-deiodinase
VVIYISEAHAADEWSLSLKYQINQHKSIEDRIAAAKFLIKEKNYKYRIFVDSFDGDSNNSFEKTYSGWPERGFIFHKGKIVHISYGTIEGTINWREEIGEWLESNKEQF